MCTQGSFRSTFFQTHASLADILISPVMSKCVIDVFQVIQIQHNKCSMSDFFSSAKDGFAFTFECTSVIEACQRIIISFMFNTKAFSHRNSYIFHETDLYPVLIFDFHSHITNTFFRNSDTVQFCAA